MPNFQEYAAKREELERDAMATTLEIINELVGSVATYVNETTDRVLAEFVAELHKFKAQLIDEPQNTDSKGDKPV